MSQIAFVLGYQLFGFTRLFKYEHLIFGTKLPKFETPSFCLENTEKRYYLTSGPSCLSPLWAKCFG